MTVYTFTDELTVPHGREKVFAFFADAQNLEALTPPWLRFVIETPHPIVMRRGAIIDYRLRIRGVPVKWKTEITCWEPPGRFIDEQRRGPYRQWIHEHTFEAVPGGTIVRDSVAYAVPGGALVNRFFVRKDVEKIFAFRKQALSALL